MNDLPTALPTPRDDAAVGAALDAALARARQLATYADAVYERVYKSELNLMSDGQRIIKPASLKGAAQVRLVGDGGRHVGVRVGDIDPAQLTDAVERAALALAAERAEDFGPSGRLPPTKANGRARRAPPRSTICGRGDCPRRRRK